MSQFIQFYQLLWRNTRNTCIQSVNQAHIIMARNITDHLCRLFSPESLTIIHQIIVHLRMLDSTDNTELDTLLSSRNSGKKSTLMIVIERATQSIAHFIRECSDTRHPVSICFHSQRVFRHLGSFSRPTFTINNDTRVNCRSCLTNFIHRCYIMNAHQIKAKTVKVIFINPMQHGFYHIFPHHRTVTCRFIATSGSVSKATIRHLAIKISRHCTFKVAFSRIECMIIHHVQHYTNSCFMQCLHHLFELFNTNRRIIRIGRI